MPRFFHLARRRQNAAPQTKRRVSVRTSKKAFPVIFSGLLLLAIIAYLVQANSIATKGYMIKDLEQDLAELKQISRELEAKSLELQSAKKVSEKLETMQMEVAKNVKYAQPEPKVVAR